MKDEQRIVADWMRWVMYRRNLTAEQWGQRAGIAGSTIQRAMRDSYGGVTTLPILDRLARAAGVPSPLEMLKPDIAESFSLRSTD